MSIWALLYQCLRGDVFLVLTLKRDRPMEVLEILDLGGKELLLLVYFLYTDELFFSYESLLLFFFFPPPISMYL